MPEPAHHPHYPAIRRVAWIALGAGVLIMALKLGIFALTQSTAVLSDALESIINIVAACFMIYSVWLANRPADEDHPYGHGKIEFMTLGLEGWLILTAGVVIGWVAIRRLIWPMELPSLDLGIFLLAGVNLLSGALAGYVYWAGRRYQSPSLHADGKHLWTDSFSTLGVFLGLIAIRLTGWHWLDPLVAILISAVILYTSWHLLWQSIHGLMDRSDPRDQAAITAILDQEVAAGHIRGYHKVRHRHAGSFHWVDMHLQVDPSLTVQQSHDLASRIEHQVEEKLGPANATAHIEPG